ncbi:MAG: ATP synthase F1 subunit epsilon [Prevotella sp.]|nr:ATP synthase F1 subunit epsilon [Candidatus Equicola faecalis]MDO4819816.1 ATP synthase F1 subunit epsilon [Prevotella sp.]
MLSLKIVSPERTVFNGQVESVEVPGLKGRFEVLTGHAAILSILDKGTVHWTTTEGEQSLNIVYGGFITVNNNVVTITVEEDK